MNNKQLDNPLDNGNKKSKEIRIVRQTNNESSNKASVFLRIRSKVGAPYAVENNVFRIRNYKSENLSKSFTFSSIFRHDSTQQQVYRESVEQAIEKGENLTVLTYGTSNSGKTFTLIGDEKQPGIVPRAIEHIFNRYRKNTSSTPTLKTVKGEWSILDDEAVEEELKIRRFYFSKLKCFAVPNAEKRELSEHCYVDEGSVDTRLAFIWISFVEIHNENVFDLLESTPTKINKTRRSLTVVANGGNAYISGLTSVLVTSRDEAVLLLDKGIKSRQNGSTSINPQSSRSHCIFIVDVLQQDQAKATVTQTRHKFCDLAGSERLKKSEAEGARCDEAKNINKSLLVLGRCLNSIYINQRTKTKEMVVPFRESKLTFFLQTSLTGHEKLSFIVNMLPTADFHDENEQILRYASMAQEIVYQKPVEAKVGRRSTFSNFLYSNSPESVKYPQLQLILNENEKLKTKISLLEAEYVEHDDVEQKNREIQQLNEIIVQLKRERDLGIEKYANQCEETNDVDLIYVDSPNLYKVDEVISSRIRKGKKEYLVKWSPSWVSKNDVTKDLIEAFEENRAGPNSSSNLK